MSNVKFDKMEKQLRYYIESFKSPHLKAIFENLLTLLYEGVDLSERDIDNAHNGAIRGSEFPGDLVGRPADDFDEDEEDDEKPI
ncbi:MAG: hypothetical protein H7Y09_14305, partial [Chitinophagaceae bacterium]|nr:hypothetical protein [Anaerolineae bacterium]